MAEPARPRARLAAQLRRSAAGGSGSVDLNAAIDAYSESFGNRLEPLRKLCKDDALADKLAAEIVAVQEAIIALVRERAGDEGLPMAAIVQAGRDYVSAAGLPIDERGLQALMRYVVWYSWHEGYLRREPRQAEPLYGPANLNKNDKPDPRS